MTNAMCWEFVPVKIMHINVSLYCTGIIDSRDINIQMLNVNVKFNKYVS
jgi:hypothetical protein